MQPGWCQPVRQEFMENECEALPGVAYPGVRDNRSTINTKTGYDDDDDIRGHFRHNPSQSHDCSKKTGLPNEITKTNVTTGKPFMQSGQETDQVYLQVYLQPVWG